VIDYLDVGPRYGIQKVRPPATWIGKSLGDLDLVSTLRLTPLAVRRGSDVTVTPALSETIRDGDELILIGLDERLEQVGD
jgi:trk system potassium uptake protein TrkA